MKAIRKNFMTKWKAAMRILLSFNIRPYPQFKRLAAAVTVLVVALALFHIYFFHLVENGAVFAASDATAAPAPTVDETKVTDILNRFSDKAAARASAATLVPSVVQPSA